MEQASVKASALAGWSTAMADQGIDPRAAAAAAGISHQSFDRPDDSVPLRAFAALSEYAGTKSLNPAFGWKLGERFDLNDMDSVGEAVLSASTLGTALKRLTDYFPLLQDSSEMRLVVEQDMADISYRILDPDIWPRHHDAMFSLGIVSQVIKMAVPEAFQHFSILFESAPRQTGLAMGQAQLAFSGETNSLRLPSRLLDAVMPKQATPVDLRALSSKLADKNRTMSARWRLQNLIFAQLSECEINQQQLAKDIGMSSRTMRRRLACDGLSFQQLLDDCRMSQAKLEFSARPSMSIAEIALKLGYSEHSTFTRAFTRWAGIPPQKFRAQLSESLH